MKSVKIFKTQKIEAAADPVGVHLFGFHRPTQWAEVAGCDDIMVQAYHAVAGKGVINVYSAVTISPGGTPQWTLEGSLTDNGQMKIDSRPTAIKLTATDVGGGDTITSTNYLTAEIRAC